MKKYTKEELKVVINELKLNLPIELTFKTGDADVIEINENGTVICKNVKSGFNSNININELSDELVNNNTNLVNYILKNK